MRKNPKLAYIRDLLYLTEPEVIRFFGKSTNNYNSTYIKYGPEIITRKVGVIGSDTIVRNVEGVIKQLITRELVPLTLQYVQQYRKENLSTICTVPATLNSLGKLLTNIVCKAHSQENVEVQIFPDSVYSIILTIRYPEITITSESGMTHVAKDVFVKMPFTSDLAWRDITIGRTTFTAAEVKAGYILSHIHGIIGNYSIKVCFGKNTLLSKMQDRFGYNIRHNTSLIPELIMMVGQFIRSESLSGVPYRKIRDASPKNSVRQSKRTDAPKEIIDQVISRLYKLDIVTGDNKEMELKIPQQEQQRIEEELLSAGFPLVPILEGEELMYNPQAVNTPATLALNGRNSEIEFKGQIVPLTIEPIEVTEQEALEGIPIGIPNNWITQIEELLKKALIENLIQTRCYDLSAISAS